MKSQLYLVERFKTPPPILGGHFPSSPYAFLVHFKRSIPDLEAQKHASQTVTNLLQIDKDNPHRVDCPNEHISKKTVDLSRLGQPLAIPEGFSDEWAIVVPPGSHIPLTILKPEEEEAAQ